jgi:hypothetical protein
MMPDDTKTRAQLRDVQDYRKLVLLYEALDAEIDQLIMTYGGHSEDMPEADFERYRNLAHKRDELQNDIRATERRLLGGDLAD